MYLRHVSLNLRSIVFTRCQNVGKLIFRTLSNSSNNKIDLSQVKKFSNENHNDEIDTKVTIETINENKTREKIEWDRLSFVEKFVETFFSSQINSIAILIVAGVGYVIYEQVKNDYEIKSTFRNGSCPNFKFKEKQLLERKSLLNSLVTILTPVADKLVSSYYIVLGEHGVGKSTLIRQAARIVGRGVIYVDVPSNVKKFGVAFAHAINFDFKEHIRLSTWIESTMFSSPPDEGMHSRTCLFFDKVLANDYLFIVLGEEKSWERVLLIFEKYAIDFKKKYGCVPVLILDNCDILAEKDPEMLEILQDTAKTAIDDSSWITVFVTSVGIAPEQMEVEVTVSNRNRKISLVIVTLLDTYQKDKPASVICQLSRSSITRASTFFEISDLSEEESMTYLIEKRNLSQEIAKDLYNLFGGRIKSLQNAASKLESGVSFHTIRKSILQDIARRIEKIRCRKTLQEQTFLFNVLCVLSYQPEITIDELIEIEQDATVRQKMLDELRDETILIRSVSTGSYIYHSQSIKVCIEEYYKDKCLHYKTRRYYYIFVC
ncbi:unnamed protein product [Rotaria sp. Silwood1]|nr:unnamed protein product [Rotaria sp. Silwood1]